MKANRLLLACALAALISACATERRTTSAPAPTPTPTPTAVAAVVPPASWREAPLTPGQWSYARAPGESLARFGSGLGESLLTVRCQRGRPGVTMLRAGTAPYAVPLTVVTTDGARAFSAAPEAGGLAALAVRFAARDPFLDMVAFSRGRFAVETPGLPTLYLPAWPEIGRVIEDCR